MQSCTIGEALSATTISGLVVGGGNLVSWSASSSINYVESSEFAKIVHPSFCWVPYILLAKYGIPYAYNHVGVAKLIPQEKQSLVKLVIEPSSFISCRDSAGAAHLRQAGVTSPIIVGPDSAIDIAHVFSGQALREHYHRDAREKYGIPRNMATAVVHIKERYLKNQAEEVAQIAAILSKNGIHPIFIPLGMCHGDDAVLNDQRLQAHPATRIFRPESLIDMLSLLATSRYYIGSSLHGAIASLSYKNNIVIVADEKISGMSKFSGFLTQVNLSNCLYDSWKGACASLATHGMIMFGAISTSKISELGNRRDTWEDIYQSLHLAPRERPTLNKALAKSVHDHYGI
jgi:polysaccharide pyruvyl transferase WcaK-like protein